MSGGTQPSGLSRPGLPGSGTPRSEAGDWRGRLLRFVQTDLWSAEAMARHGLARVQGVLQFSVAVAEGIVQDAILLRASALTYYAALSIIPMLALAISIAQAVGVEVGEALINLTIELLAPSNPEAAEAVKGLVQGINFASLGTIGAAILFGTTVLGISSIERTLNTIWGVTHERPWDRRFADYVAVLTIAPLVLGVALSLGTTLQTLSLVRELREVAVLDATYRTGLRYAPTALLAVGFAFLYWFIPNTRVRPLAALIGAALAALLFTGAQKIYVAFGVGVTRNNALYGGLAALPLLLIWIYTSWAIILLGAEVAAVYQNLATVRRVRRGQEPSAAARESIGLAIATVIARSFDLGEDPPQPESLADRLEIPMRSVRSILDDLESAGIVSVRESTGKEETYQLGRSAERIAVVDVIDALRGSRPDVRLGEVAVRVRAVLDDADRRAGEALEGMSLAQLVHGTRPSTD